MDPCTVLSAKMGELFMCTQVNGRVRIRTPFLYPDGDVVDLFLQDGGDAMTLTDLGETLRWLRLQALSTERSPRQRQLIADVLLTHGVELYKGMLQVRLTGLEDIANAVTRLSQACLRTADLWFTFRTRAVQSIADDVAELLEERTIPFDRGEKLPGRSGRFWSPDFHTRVTARSSLVYVMSTGSRAAARQVSEHVLAAWYDLSYMKVGPESLHFISLFDDTLDVWSTEDFELVRDLSTVCYWSKPDSFIEELAA